jgi:hypothetical protein
MSNSLTGSEDHGMGSRQGIDSTAIEQTTGKVGGLGSLLKGGLIRRRGFHNWGTW